MSLFGCQFVSAVLFCTGDKVNLIVYRCHRDHFGTHFHVKTLACSPAGSQFAGVF